MDYQQKLFFQKYMDTVPESVALQRGMEIHQTFERLIKSAPELFDIFEELTAEPEWTTQWPQKEGWYWAWQKEEDASSIRPVEVHLAGSKPQRFWTYVRNGEFLFPHEQCEPVWWLPLALPMTRPLDKENKR